MGVVDLLQRDNAMSDLERNTLHAVRGLLKVMGVYHAIWEIVIHQKSPNTLEITAWVPERITMPHGMSKPIIPIHFGHAGEVMREFTDVAFLPIARELGKEMVKAYQMGANYKQV